jgi:hypothetical protein
VRQRTVCVTIAGVIAAIAACADTPQEPITPAAAYSSARSLWQATRPVRYTFVASRACECLPEAAGPVRIEVNGTTIVSVQRVDNSNVVDPALWFDINGLFDLIDRELVALPSRLEAAYDPGDGHPTRVAYGEREVDGGAIIQVTEFVVLTGGTTGYLRR